MARPIEAIPPFRGRAAKWLAHYLKTAQADPSKHALARQDREVAKRIKPLPTQKLLQRSPPRRRVSHGG